MKAFEEPCFSGNIFALMFFHACIITMITLTNYFSTFSLNVEIVNISAGNYTHQARRLVAFHLHRNSDLYKIKIKRDIDENLSNDPVFGGLCLENIGEYSIVKSYQTMISIKCSLFSYFSVHPSPSLFYSF